MILINLLTIISSLIIGATCTNNVPVNFNPIHFSTFNRVRVIDGGKTAFATLDDKFVKFQSKFKMVHGRADVQILARTDDNTGDGHVNTEFGLQGPQGEKIILYLQNVYSGYTLHTRVVYLWFDPTKFNTYSIYWNANNILFYVNNVPISIINTSALNKTPMELFGSVIFEKAFGESHLPMGEYFSTFTNIKLDKACLWLGSKTSCEGDSSSQSWRNQRLDTPGTLSIIKGVQDRHSYVETP